MLKILQTRLHQYVNKELPDAQAGFRKGRGTRDQIANIYWIIEKAREFQKNIYFCYIEYAKAFDCVDHHKLWKILQEMGIPDHLTCLFRNLYAGQEATVRTGHGTIFFPTLLVDHADISFCNPTDVNNLIPGSSAFSKSSLNIWKFTVHVLLTPGLENFQHYFASV